MELTHLQKTLLVTTRQTAEIRQLIVQHNTGSPAPKAVPRQSIFTDLFNSSFPP